MSTWQRDEQEQELLDILAAETDELDNSYDVFRKSTSMFTPMSAASTAPTSMLTDTSISDACVHRKWEELAETWKATMRASPSSPLWPSSMDPPSTQLLRLSPLKHRPRSPTSPSYSSPLHSSLDADFLGSLEQPFRPYGFEWIDTPNSQGERLSRFAAYTNMCVFDRLYRQANIPYSPNRVPSPPKPSTRKSSEPTKSQAKSKRQESHLSTPTSDVMSSARGTKHAGQKSKPASAAKQPWRSSSHYMRDFSSPPPPLAVTKGKPISTPNPNEPRPRPIQTPESAENKTSTSAKPGQSPKSAEQLKDADASQPLLASPENDPEKKDARHSKSPARKQQSPSSKKSPWKSPSRSPRSFSIRPVSPEPITTIQIRMLRTDVLKELMDLGGASKNRQTQKSDSPRYRQWAAMFRPRLQHPLDSSLDPESSFSLQIPTLEYPSNGRANGFLPISHVPEEQRQHVASVQLQKWWRRRRISSSNRPKKKNSGHYSPLAAAGADSAVQSKYKDSYHSLGQKQELVAAYRQARHKVERKQQHPSTPMQRHSHAGSSVRTPKRSLRDKWKAKQPMHQRHAAAKRIQNWYRPFFKPKKSSIRVIQRFCRRICTRKRRRNRAAISIQVRWRYCHNRRRKRLAEQKAAELLQLCWWRKLSPEETKRVEKAATKHPYSHIPLQVKKFMQEFRFVRESREDRAAEPEPESAADRAPSSVPEEIRIGDDHLQQQVPISEREQNTTVTSEEKPAIEQKSPEHELPIPVEPIESRSTSRIVTCRRAYELQKRIEAKKRQTSGNANAKGPIVVVESESEVQENDHQLEALIESMPEGDTKAAVETITDVDEGKENKPSELNLENPKTPMTRLRIQIRHIDLSVGEKKVAMERQRWEDKISAKLKVEPDLKDDKTTKIARKRHLSLGGRAATSIDLDGLYRKAFAVRLDELKERRRARIRAAQRLRNWWTASLVVWMRTRQRRRSATKIQAVYRGYRCYAAYWSQYLKLREGSHPSGSNEPSPNEDAVALSPATVEMMIYVFKMAKKFALNVLIVTGCAITIFTILLIVALYRVDGIVSVKHDRH